MKVRYSLKRDVHVCFVNVKYWCLLHRVYAGETNVEYSFSPFIPGRLLYIYFILLCIVSRHSAISNDRTANVMVLSNLHWPPANGCGFPPNSSQLSHIGLVLITVVQVTYSRVGYNTPRVGYKTPRVRYKTPQVGYKTPSK